MNSSRELLLSVLTDDCLKETGSLPFNIIAKAKLLASDLVQEEEFNLQSTSELLGSMGGATNERGSFRFTPIELVIDASRVMAKLAEHKRVLVEADIATGQPGL